MAELDPALKVGVHGHIEVECRTCASPEAAGSAVLALVVATELHPDNSVDLFR